MAGGCIFRHEESVQVLCGSPFGVQSSGGLFRADYTSHCAVVAGGMLFLLSFPIPSRWRFRLPPGVISMTSADETLIQVVSPALIISAPPLFPVVSS